MLKFKTFFNIREKSFKAAYLIVCTTILPAGTLKKDLWKQTGEIGVPIENKLHSGFTFCET